MVAEGRAKKGDVLGVAQVAGIMGAKRTAGLIPLCHTLMLTKVGLEFTLRPETNEIEALCTVACDGKTAWNGGADRRNGRAFDGVRYVQGRGQAHGHWAGAPGGKAGRQERRL